MSSDPHTDPEDFAPDSDPQDNASNPRKAEYIFGGPDICQIVADLSGKTTYGRKPETTIPHFTLCDADDFDPEKFVDAMAPYFLGQAILRELQQRTPPTDYTGSCDLTNDLSALAYHTQEAMEWATLSIKPPDRAKDLQQNIMYADIIVGVVTSLLDNYQKSLTPKSRILQVLHQAAGFTVVSTQSWMKFLGRTFESPQQRRARKIGELISEIKLGHRVLSSVLKEAENQEKTGTPFDVDKALASLAKTMAALNHGEGRE